MNAPTNLFSSGRRREVVPSDAVAVYRRREKLEKISAYVPPLVKAKFLLLGKVWSAMDRIEDPKVVDWSDSETLRRLVESAIDLSFEELGIDPKTLDSEEALARAEAAIAKKYKLTKVG